MRRLIGGLRRKTTGLKGVHNALKPFSAIPSPPGALPILGHVRLLKDVTSLTSFVTKQFKELGPIFKLNFMGQIQLYSLSN